MHFYCSFDDAWCAKTDATDEVYEIVAMVTTYASPAPGKPILSFPSDMYLNAGFQEEFAVKYWNRKDRARRISNIVTHLQVYMTRSWEYDALLRGQQYFYNADLQQYEWDDHSVWFVEPAPCLVSE